MTAKTLQRRARLMTKFSEFLNDLEDFTKEHESALLYPNHGDYDGFSSMAIKRITKEIVVAMKTVLEELPTGEMRTYSGPTSDRL